MNGRAKRWFELFKNAGIDWSTDRSPQLGAALAFYTIFSLAPLLTIVISIAALWFSENASQQIFRELGSIIGPQTADSLQSVLVQDASEKTSGVFTTVSATVMLVIGATAVFMQLQDSLNQIWQVKPKAGQSIMNFIRHRLLSFAMILAIAFLLLVSLLLSTALAAVGKYFSGMLGDTNWLFQLLNAAVSFALITVLFAMMFKYVPDARISWKDVWVGALFTAALFTAGKFALGMYLGKSSIVSTYKAAGALLVVLLWVYYTAQIVFFGAELTQMYARMHGRAVRPSPHAEMDREKECQNEAAEERREAKAKARAGEQGPAAQLPRPAPRPTHTDPEPVTRVVRVEPATERSRTFWSRMALGAFLLSFAKRRASRRR